MKHFYGINGLVKSEDDRVFRVRDIIYFDPEGKNFNVLVETFDGKEQYFLDSDYSNKDAGIYIWRRLTRDTDPEYFI